MDVLGNYKLIILISVISMAFDVVINKSNIVEQFKAFGNEVDQILESGGQARVVVTKKNNGTLPMLKLWWAWMGILGPWMAQNGATMPLCIKDGKPWGSRQFDAHDCHELFCHSFMPVDEMGKRYSWVLNKDANNGRKAADIGMRLRCMDQMLEWATERGIALPVPEQSEYYQTKRQTVE